MLPWWVLFGGLLSGLLVVVGRRVGWLDPRPGAVPLERKAQRAPAAPVGGAVVVGVAILGLPIVLWEGFDLGAWTSLSGAEVAAVLLAFAVGTIDDLLRDGLAPAPKVAAQLAASLPLLADGGPLAVVVAIVAMNAVNTFDNSDGAAASFGSVALLLPNPAAAGALLGFLPWNLRRGSDSLPKAYLGDSGSHAIGMLVAVHPASWPALALPLLDLVRVVHLRHRAGQPAWVGDRRHLPQALERIGLPSWGRVAVLSSAAAPAALIYAHGVGRAVDGPVSDTVVHEPILLPAAEATRLAAIGVGLTTLAFLALCAWVARRGGKDEGAPATSDRS